MTPKLRLITLVLVLAPTIPAETLIYSNVATDLGTSLTYANTTGLVEAGDQIAFGGTARYLTRAEFQIYNDSTTATLSSATLRLYNVSGNTLGSLFGTFTLGSQSYAAAAVATLVFDLPYTLTGEDIVWTLAFSDNRLGLNYFSPPTTGTSSPTNAWWDTGSGLTSTTFPAGNEDYNALFAAEAETPEPSTWMMAGGALLVLAWRRAKVSAAWKLAHQNPARGVR